MTDAEAKREERRRAAAAHDAMVARRPLRPPPLPRYAGAVRSAGAIELEREKRLGVGSVEGLWIK